MWIQSGPEPLEGRVAQAADVPRSYVVSTPEGNYRRNRNHLSIMPGTSETPESEPPPASISLPPIPEPEGIMTRTRTGTILPVHYPK